MKLYEVVEVQVPFMFQLKDKKHYKVRNVRTNRKTLGSYTTIEAAQVVCDRKNAEVVVLGKLENANQLRERFFS